MYINKEKTRFQCNFFKFLVFVMFVKENLLEMKLCFIKTVENSEGGVMNDLVTDTGRYEMMRGAVRGLVQ